MNFINELLFSFSYRRYGEKETVFILLMKHLFQKGEEGKMPFTHSLTPPLPPPKTKNPTSRNIHFFTMDPIIYNYAVTYDCPLADAEKK